MHKLPDLYDHKSAGTGKITARINSNEYMLSLLGDYGFKLSPRQGQTTADIFPSDYRYVRSHLENYLIEHALNDDYIAECLDRFDYGYNI